MKIFCTGANGYLGSTLLPMLSSRGHTVYGIDSHQRTVHGKECDYRQALMDAEAIVHLAWYSTAGSNHADLHEECLTRTSVLAQQAKVLPRLQRFIFASSAAVYGDSGDEEMKEEHALTPACAYGHAKAAAEDVIRQHLHNHVILRLGSLMGIGVGRTKLDVIVNAIANDAYRTRRVAIWHPNAHKPIIHVRDAAKVIIDAVECDNWQGTVNVASSSVRAINVAAMARFISGAEISIVDAPEGSGSRSCRLDCARLRHLMPFLEYRRLGPTIREFASYREREGDRLQLQRWKAIDATVAIG